MHQIINKIMYCIFLSYKLKSNIVCQKTLTHYLDERRKWGKRVHQEKKKEENKTKEMRKKNEKKKKNRKKCILFLYVFGWVKSESKTNGCCVKNI